MDADLDKIVVGQIDKIEKHPDADKLIICQVNVGANDVQIVTGIANVKEGDKIPLILDGGVWHGGHEPGQRCCRQHWNQEKQKFRGVNDAGVVCCNEERL